MPLLVIIVAAIMIGLYVSLIMEDSPGRYFCRFGGDSRNADYYYR